MPDTPFRGSELAGLLQDPPSGGAYSLMNASVSPTEWNVV